MIITGRGILILTVSTDTLRIHRVMPSFRHQLPSNKNIGFCSQPQASPVVLRRFPFNFFSTFPSNIPRYSRIPGKLEKKCKQHASMPVPLVRMRRIFIHRRTASVFFFVVSEKNLPSRLCGPYSKIRSSMRSQARAF